MREPLLLPVVALVSGILLAKSVELWGVELAIGLGAFLLLGLLKSRLASPCRLLAIVAAGGLIANWHRPARAPEIDAQFQETVTLSGCVVEPSVFSDDRDQFTLELAHRARARVTLTLRESESGPKLRYGQRVEVAARVRRPHNFNNPGAFDYTAYLARQYIYWTASARKGAQVDVLPGSCGSRFMAAIFGLRTAALEQVERLYPHDSYATGMTEAFLLGESSKLQKVWTEHFRRTGTFHALVISGMHVSVLAATLLFLLRICMVGELPALAVTALAAWLYALVSGWSAPVVRAAGGFTLYLIGRYFYRERRLLNLVAAVAIAYLVFDPDQMFDPSFQLSFLSVAAIGALAVPLIERSSGPLARGSGALAEKDRDLHMPARAAQFRVELRLAAETLSFWTHIPMRWLLALFSPLLRLIFFAYDMVVISTVIQVGLALPMAVYFHRISISGLTANVLVVPIMSVVVPAGFFAIFTGWHPAAALVGWLFEISEKIVAWHAAWEPNWRIPDPPLWLGAAFVAALLAVAFTLRARPRWRWAAFVPLAALFALLCWHPFAPRVEPGILELTAVDVGQGDSLLLGFPDGRIMVMDGGGFPPTGRKSKPKIDMGEDVVSPYLWSRSIRRVDVLALTHAHEDHMEGLDALIDNFQPKELWVGAMGESPGWQRLRDHARRRRVAIRALHRAERFGFGGAQVDVLAPAPDYVPGAKPKNNDSLVLRIAYGAHSFLLTGDMERQVEAQLASDGTLIHSDVLKAGHHGSKTSSTAPFLDLVHPSFAIISDGFENSFHHPSPEVLERLSERRVATFRTDLAGLVSIRSDGRRLSVETGRGADSGLYQPF